MATIRLGPTRTRENPHAPPAYSNEARPPPPPSPRQDVSPPRADDFEGSENPTTLHSFNSFQRHSGNLIGLNVYSFALNGASTPFFWTGTTIAGWINLELPGLSSPEKDRIKNISLELRCVRIVSGSKGVNADLGDQAFERPIVIIPITLINSANGDEVGRLPADGTRHSWSFSVQLPFVFTSQGKKSATFPMPPTFSRSGFQEFYKYELQVTVKKTMLWTNETFNKQLIVLPRSVPPRLPSQYLQAAYEHGVPLPLPSTAPECWIGKTAELVLRVGNYEAEVFLKFFVADPIHRARGTPIPLAVSLNITSISPIASSSSSSSSSPTPSSSPEIYHTIYSQIRSAIEITLESVYPIGHNASTGFVMGLPFDKLPPATELNAECIIEQVALSAPLWDTGLAYSGSRIVRDKEDEKGMSNGVELADEKMNGGWEGDGRAGGTEVGVEAWLQGEIIPRGNIMPDFVSPNIRLSHAVSLRIESTRSFVVVSINPPPSASTRKQYAPFAPPPILSLPVIITTHSLPGDLTRSVAPLPDY